MVLSHEALSLGCATLDEVEQLIGDCHRCTLSAERTCIVFGSGDARARVMVIGEAPGKHEDATGLPFVGAAGKLLDEALGYAALDRSRVFIANVVKCRPPANRDPQPVEIETCTQFLREQIRLVSPEVLVTLGNFATRFVLGTGAGITGLRGKVHHVDGFKVLPVYHPAATIYDRTKREPLFADFALLGELLA